MQCSATHVQTHTTHTPFITNGVVRTYHTDSYGIAQPYCASYVGSISVNPKHSPVGERGEVGKDELWKVMLAVGTWAGYSPVRSPGQLCT